MTHHPVFMHLCDGGPWHGLTLALSCMHTQTLHMTIRQPGVIWTGRYVSVNQKGSMGTRGSLHPLLKWEPVHAQ